MTPTQRELARHALGLPNKRHESYRNHFVTGVGSIDYPEWTSLVEAGHAKRYPPSDMTGGDDLFILARQGAEAALLGKERLSQEDFK